MEEYVYVLKLNKGHYYVGKTNNVARRFEEHKSKSENSSSWVKQHEVLALIEVKPLDNQFSEDVKTLEYMNKYGIDNVRGGSYVEIRLSNDEITNINKQLRSANNLCFKCGKPGHFVKECPSNSTNSHSTNLLKDKNVVTLEKPVIIPTTTIVEENTGFFGNIIKSFSALFVTQPETKPLISVMITEEVPKVIVTDVSVKKPRTSQNNSNQLCERCGRNTHNSDKCYARTHLKGHNL